jgi:hypothetical protein
VTCNLILVSRAEPRTHSLYYGQDSSFFNPKRAELDTIYFIRKLSDIRNVPVNLDLSDFQQELDRIFDTSDAQVHSLVNIIYIVKKFLTKGSNRYFKTERKSRKRVRKDRKGQTAKIY